MASSRTRRPGAATVVGHPDNGKHNGITRSHLFEVTPRPPLRQIYGSSTKTVGLNSPSAAKRVSVSSTDQTEHRWSSLLILVLIFTSAVLLMYFVYSTFPDLKEEEKKYVKLPRSMDDARNLGRVLTAYKTDHYAKVLGGLCTTYIFLQSFAIPGSIFLSVLSGYLLPFYFALLLVCFCSAAGASVCYGLSYLVGRRIVLKYIPQRVAQWSAQVEKHRSHLLNYMLFLRITPFLPNWFINIASPIINVPIVPFFFGTFFGVAPPSFFTVQMGTTLYEMTDAHSAFNWFSAACLAAMALLSLLPVLLKTKLKEKFA